MWGFVLAHENHFGTGCSCATNCRARGHLPNVLELPFHHRCTHSWHHVSHTHHCSSCSVWHWDRCDITDFRMSGPITRVHFSCCASATLLNLSSGLPLLRGMLHLPLSHPSSEDRINTGTLRDHRLVTSTRSTLYSTSPP